MLGRYLIFFMMVFLLASCGGAEEEQKENNPGYSPPEITPLKGPVLSGSATLTPVNCYTGAASDSSVVQVVSNGKVKIEKKFNSECFILIGLYRFLNEATGDRSGKIILTGHITKESRSTNVLTHIIFNRVDKLLEDGLHIEEASLTAYEELRGFNVSSPPSSLSFRGDSASGYLLAMSAVISSSDDPQELIDSLKDDFSDGSLSPESKEKISNLASKIDPAKVASILDEHYGITNDWGLGEELRKIMDTDNDGYSDYDDDDSTTLIGAEDETVEPVSYYSWVVDALGPVEGHLRAKLNGKFHSDITKDSKLVFKIESPGPGDCENNKLEVGDESIIINLCSREPTVLVDNGWAHTNNDDIPAALKYEVPFSHDGQQARYFSVNSAPDPWRCELLTINGSFLMATEIISNWRPGFGANCDFGPIELEKGNYVLHLLYKTPVSIKRYQEPYSFGPKPFRYSPDGLTWKTPYYAEKQVSMKIYN